MRLVLMIFAALLALGLLIGKLKGGGGDATLVAWRDGAATFFGADDRAPFGAEAQGPPARKGACAGRAALSVRS